MKNKQKFTTRDMLSVIFILLILIFALVAANVQGTDAAGGQQPAATTLTVNTDEPWETYFPLIPNGHLSGRD